jgi:microcystin-dependent protein
MPRNSQGLYTLPPSNPVAPNTLIEATWANSTMEDIAAALTGSLPRNGSAPMTDSLILAPGTPTQPREAVGKEYVDQFMAYSSGMPVGAVAPFAGSVAPTGWFLCDGQAISRTTYSDLFATIGVIYGSGDGTTTFNVPDLRNEFIRGRLSPRALGSKQAASFASHIHALSDPSHAHAISIWSGTENASHTHSVSGSTSTEGSHAHGLLTGTVSGGSAGGTAISSVGVQAVTESAGSHAHSFSATSTVESATHSHAVNGSSGASATGVSMGATGGTETVPQNTALDFYIKAVQDGTGAGSLMTGIDTSDVDMIAIDNTNPVVPILNINSNAAFGIPKLDASGKISLDQMPTTGTQFLGYFDASPGLLPSGTFVSGQFFVISVGGTLTVFDPVTLTSSSTVVAVGSQLQYVSGSVTNPEGWYYVSVNNVNFVGKTGPNGAAIIPAGTDAQRPTGVDGYFRYNNQQNVFEGYTPNGWGQVGGGQMYGSAAVKAIFYNAQSIAEDLTVKTGENGGSFGPVTINNGFTVTVEADSVWTIT